ncbi:hypothetical protein [Intestinibacillus massiliensis]|uniref:hypothetical protein n=1 Tax=Intestinibacillus massiliensis TaxID=1871029 RepID=UPI000B35E0B5|nr:hypothetical protein [Intestinibacillus massiliensis]
MDKRVIVVNGRGGVGKDTVCALAGQFYKVRNISSITPIVEIARFAGWDGEKTPAARRLLSRLKEVFTEYNDLSFSYCMRQYIEFLEGDEQVLFVHIREPEEIERFRKAVGGCCHTLLVRRRIVEAEGALGNRSDDSVLDYRYDYYFDNDGPLEQLAENVHAFFEVVLDREFADDTVTWYFR